MKQTVHHVKIFIGVLRKGNNGIKPRYNEFKIFSVLDGAVSEPWIKLRIQIYKAVLCPAPAYLQEETLTSQTTGD